MQSTHGAVPLGPLHRRSKRNAALSATSHENAKKMRTFRPLKRRARTPPFFAWCPRGWKHSFRKAAINDDTPARK
eukprot:15381693-Alexandrium_andersonii.AAC.1